MKNSRMKVQKILRTVLLNGLSAIGLGDWKVQEFAASQYVSLDKCVLMNLTRTNRLGWQHMSNPIVQDAITRKDEWLESQSWQIHVIAKRPIEITENSIVVEDVTEDLIAWLNGAGMESFRSMGVAPERIDGDMTFVYNDDNEIYQKRCVFTVKIQVPKELVSGETPEAEILVPHTLPV